MSFTGPSETFVSPSISRRQCSRSNPPDPSLQSIRLITTHTEEDNATQSGCFVYSLSDNLRRCSSALNLTTKLLTSEVDAREHTIPRRIVRPLPPVPISVSPTSWSLTTPSEGSPRGLRPLPSPPTSPSHYNTQFIFTPQSDHSRSPSLTSALNAKSSRPLLAPLLTSSKSLKSPPTELLQVGSPTTPSTPRTAKRKRIAKLRRYLGEPIPEDVIPPIQVLPSKGKLEVLKDDWIYMNASIVVGKILEMSDNDEASDTSWDDEEEEESVSPQMMNNGSEWYSEGRRLSRRWMREKGGKRWEEHDYASVLDSLRAL